MKKKEYNKVLDIIINANEHKINTIQHVISKKVYIQIQDRLLIHFEEFSVKILKDKAIINISNINMEIENFEEDKNNDFKLM